MCFSRLKVFVLLPTKLWIIQDQKSYFSFDSDEISPPCCFTKKKVYQIIKNFTLLKWLTLSFLLSEGLCFIFNKIQGQKQETNYLLLHAYTCDYRTARVYIYVHTHMHVCLYIHVCFLHHAWSSFFSSASNMRSQKCSMYFKS